MSTAPSPARNAPVADALGAVLADSFRLYVTTHGFHWNVQGPRFPTLHAMFEDQYRALWTALDEIAERIRALGHPAPGSVGAFAAAGTLPDHDGALTATAMLRALLDGHEALAAQCRAALARPEVAADSASADLLTERQAAHEKAAWMLRATLAEDTAG
jgi:starvation-inducible DNA-binding protein